LNCCFLAIQYERRKFFKNSFEICGTFLWVLKSIYKRKNKFAERNADYRRLKKPLAKKK